MSSSPLVSGLVLLAACAPSRGAGSLAELESALRGAARAKDRGAFTRLLLDAEQLLAKCPSVFAEASDRSRLEADRGTFVRDAGERFLGCAAFDWDKAVEVTSERREPRTGEQAPGCAGESKRLGGFETRYRIGEEEVFVSFRVSQIDGRLFISDDFMCVRD